MKVGIGISMEEDLGTMVMEIFFTRYSKLDFPQFSGCDLRTWLYKVDQVFSIASIHLDGEAIAWHRSYVKSRNAANDLSWTEYVLDLNEGFEDPMEAIKNLRQNGSVKDYQAEFDRLLTGINLSTENAISCYLGGLKPELNKAVKIQVPRTLMQAYKVARLQEGVFEAQPHTWGFNSVQKGVNAILSTPNQFKSQNYHKPPTHQSNLVKPNRYRRLTTAEMDAKRAKGLCFFCDEKYVVGHNCSANKQLFMVE